MPSQAASAPLITALRVHDSGEFATLDAHTARNLELFAAGRDPRRDGSLLATLDLTSTSMGARLLQRRIGQPLIDIASIERRLDAVAYCHESPLRHHATLSSCSFGGHAIWWSVQAAGEAEALGLLPYFVAERATATRVREVEIP